MRIREEVTVRQLRAQHLPPECAKALVESKEEVEATLEVFTAPMSRHFAAVKCPHCNDVWYVPNNFLYPHHLIDQHKTFVELVEEAAELLKCHTTILGQDECDHEVGICYCGHYATMDKVAKLLHHLGVDVPGYKYHYSDDSSDESDSSIE